MIKMRIKRKSKQQQVKRHWKKNGRTRRNSGFCVEIFIVIAAALRRSHKL